MKRDQSVKQGQAETLAWEGNTGVEVRADSLYFPHVEIQKKKKAEMCARVDVAY